LSVSRVQDGSRSRSLIYTLHLLYSRSQTEWGGGRLLPSISLLLLLDDES
jgi:hypothetical protein